MNRCELTKLETSLRAALRANWRGEGNDDQCKALIIRYVAEVGPDMYAKLERGERAIFDDEQAVVKKGRRS